MKTKSKFQKKSIKIKKKFKRRIKKHKKEKEINLEGRNRKG